MVSGTKDNPPYRVNFIERLYEKKVYLLDESKLTLLIIHKAFKYSNLQISFFHLFDQCGLC